MHKDLTIFDSRSENNKKFNLGKKKENTIRSLSEVEHFLCQCNKAIKCGKIVNLFNHF